MFLQLLGFAVALSMTATAPAKAVSHELPNGQACETSLRTEPKRAYYDPEKSYGKTALCFYNYTGETIKIAPNQGTLENNDQGTMTINTGTNYATYHIEQYAGKLLNIGDNTKNYDLYLNGVLETTLSPTTGAYGSLPYYDYNLEINSNSYVWLVEAGKEVETQYGTTTNTYYWYSQRTDFLIGGQATIYEKTGTYTANTGGSPNIILNQTFETASDASEYIASGNLPDIYIGGTLYTGNAWGVQSQGVYLVKLEQYSIYTQATGSYIWFFDHTLSEDEKVEAEIGGIFTEVGNVVTGMADTLTKPWDGIINIFYDTTNEEVTPMGMVSLIVLGTSLVIMLFAITIRLLRQRG